MKFSFLPEEIKVEIDESLGDDPLALSRSNMSLGGSMGVSFIIAYDEILYIFSKLEGTQLFNKIEMGYSDISLIKVSKDSNNSIIEIHTGKKKHVMKFSLLEEEKINAVFGVWLASSLNPFTTLLAALMYLASEDNEFAAEENDYILKIANGDKESLGKAHDFYLSQSVEALYKILSKLSEEQKYCIMANLLELAMCDGVLHEDELKLIKAFTDSMEIAEDEYQTIKQVMVMKNKLGILK